MTFADLISLCNHAAGELSLLDWARALSGFLGGVTTGAIIAVIRRYRHLYGKQGTVRQLHVIYISCSYLLLTAALTYAEVGLIGQPPTRISWVVVTLTLAAYPLGLRALWLILRHAVERQEG